MSFDRLAPHYRWLEATLAGDVLQRCRVAFLDHVAPRHALLAGEGHGRFLRALLARHPGVKATVIDASAAMLRKARADAPGDVEFIHADLLTCDLPPGAFDLIVTHFVFDCFTPPQIEALTARLSRATTPHAHWLVADFSTPPRGPARWRAKLIVWALYLAFRAAARISATHLAPIEDALARHGFNLAERRHFDWGMLHSDLWTRFSQPEV